MARTLPLFLLLIIISCGRQEKENNTASEPLPITEAPAVEENYLFHGSLLKDYEAFLQQLDGSDANSIATAREKFAALFKDKDDQTCDSAYYMFEGFYSDVADNINAIHSNDTTNYDSLVLLNETPTLRLSEKLNGYHDKLERNGFQIAMTEGMTYIQKDRDYVKTNFYDLLSPLMVKYLEQLNQENKEGFSEDGGLVIEPTVLVDRIVWWEKFNQENGRFIFRSIPTARQRLYTNVLILGEDNTPLYYGATPG